MTIPVILASGSPSRRRVLYDAGIMPTIRVSSVDESGLLEAARRSEGAGLPIGRQVGLLARAKAQAVNRAYREVAEVSREATGQALVSRPLLPGPARKSGGAGGTTGGLGDQEDALTAEDLPTLLAGEGSLGSSGVGPLIIGCDSMFLFDGEIYGKPHDPQVALSRIEAFRGRQGQLWTGHCLIDFATGDMREGASCATVRFADYTDAEAEAYVATGEPLEVAGSFTLEGYGAAFIEGVEGDPHGVLGISLPLVRRLAADLGIAWEDLWNIRRGGQGARLTDHDKAAASTPPEGNVRQPGDGWVDCACGHRHWGLNGASGVLLVRRDGETGEPTAVAMQHRAVWSAQGGTWGVPGGAIADGENPVEGALRESHEEAGIDPEDIEVVGTFREDHGPWAYTTVFAFERPGRQVDLKANDDESLSVEWVPIDQVPDRRLLAAFKADWPGFRKRVETLAQEHRQG
ncbi:Maf family protein [Bifidobacterium favimelis]|uniref:Nucleoside triphosphate pyrophosphatase n=1 Tax=Bifidobacterium favimelis TaxID=3122979 RepID=A0ABU8ZND1_9BIFI